jgi:hypothetical protein
MNTPYRSVEDFTNTQTKEALQKYDEWKKTSSHRRIRKE